MRLLPLALLMPLLTGCYVLRQGTVLLSHQKSARPLAEVREAEDTSGETRAFLELVEEIRHFGTDQLGLSGSRNYTTYVALDKDYLVDVVSASEADRFETYTWWFPIVGAVPYKGYYNPSGARRLAERLRRRDLDVIVRKVDAFSTLGYFRDPIYSFMTGYSEFGIASLILHEQTHATIFLKGQSQFNEELASFVGIEGALLFLRKRYGESSPQYEQAVGVLADQEVFLQRVRALTAALQELYERDLGREETLERKQRIIAEHQERFGQEYDQVFATDRYRGFAEARINNAYLDLYRTYTQDLDLFYDLLEAREGDLPAVIAALKAADLRRAEDPKRIVRELSGG